MSEGIIARRTSGINNEIINQIINDYIESQKPGSNLFTENTIFTAPKSCTYTVICIGGGGGGCGRHLWYRSSEETSYYSGGGGGSGWMNQKSISLNKNDKISIIIGSGGPGSDSTNGGAGGTTTFGNYLSAIGGKGAIVNNGPGYSIGGDGQFAGNNGGGYTCESYITPVDSAGGKGGYGFYPPNIIGTASGIYGKGGNGAGSVTTPAENGALGCVWIGWS